MITNYNVPIMHNIIINI